MVPETLASPVIRSWSTYYGPGQAMVHTVLDLTRPPFKKDTTERSLNEALRRALYQTLARHPVTRKHLGRISEHRQGLWIRHNSEMSPATTSPSPSSLPPPHKRLLGDLSVYIDKDNLATLCMSLIVEGPVTGADPSLKPWVRLEADPINLARGLSSGPVAATSLTALSGSSGQALREGKVLQPGSVYLVMNQMVCSLARELVLPEPQLVPLEEVLPDQASSALRSVGMAAVTAAAWFM
ncbi:hypothetical protein PG993_014045 [Apiospora rasikravindrae]|uniref:Uncharacterized protein n=1 Tax=Apiospora rasikravindrae TaxID=990691 RepID=A0ABR1RT28_9PEZI